MNYRRFGIELEFSSEYDAVYDLLYKKFGKSIDYFKTNKETTADAEKYELKVDYTTGCEIASPILSFSKLPGVIPILDCLNAGGIVVSEKDGFHVHVGVKGIPLEKLLACWIYLEPTLRYVFPVSRTRRRTRFMSVSPAYNELYTKKISGKTVAEYFAKVYRSCHEKDRTLTFRNYDEYGTVEFRIAEGTLSYEDVYNWVKFCLCFVNYAKNIDLGDMLSNRMDSINTDRMVYLISNDHKMVKWVETRVKLFSRT